MVARTGTFRAGRHRSTGETIASVGPALGVVLRTAALNIKRLIPYGGVRASASVQVCESVFVTSSLNTCIHVYVHK